MIDYNTEQF